MPDMDKTVVVVVVVVVVMCLHMCAQGRYVLKGQFLHIPGHVCHRLDAVRPMNLFITIRSPLLYALKLELAGLPGVGPAAPRQVACGCLSLPAPTLPHPAVVAELPAGVRHEVLQVLVAGGAGRYHRHVHAGVAV